MATMNIIYFKRTIIIRLNNSEIIGYGMKDRGSIPSRSMIVLFASTYRPALGFTQPPI